MIATALVAAAAIVTALPARGFSLDKYAQQSVLSQGRWIKISVSQTGMHFIPAQTLRQWGFSKPERVRIYGYGGQRISDAMTSANFIDDLPMTPAQITAEGIRFYAQGPTSWTRSAGHDIPVQNPYTFEGYYFLTESDAEPATIETQGTPNESVVPLKTCNAVVYHERDLINIGRSGNTFVGEDFRSNRTQHFKLELPGYVAETRPWARINFAVASSSSNSFSATVNGKEVIANAIISANGDNEANRSQRNLTLEALPSNSVDFGITFNPSGIVTAAHLDHIVVNYQRTISLDNGILNFDATQTTVELEGGNASTTVWDVTEPLNITQLNTTLTADGNLLWTNDYYGSRRYTAWNADASLPCPKLVGGISNQNLHAISQMPDMVIITVRDWSSQAQRLADHHRSDALDPLDVLIVNQDDIFNEFSSGVRDFGAFRRFLKMIYDRGREGGRPLRYALLMGRGTYDNRLVEDRIKALREPLMPSWQTDESYNYNTSYTSDDLLAFLEDNSGQNLSTSRASIGVGRIPARSLSSAKNYVDKVINYTNSARKSDWRNQFVFVSDNGNDGVFMVDNENFISGLTAGEDGGDAFLTKVYVDAFPLENGTATGARNRLHRMFSEGMVWLNYVGHGATNYLCSENVLSTIDLAEMSNKQFPFLFGATCSFQRWDFDDVSGSEQMAFNTSGGTIASLVPTRKTSISDNSVAASVMGKCILNRQENGLYPTIGDIVKDFKNSMIGRAGTGRLRYTLLGDPAMRLAMPTNRVVLEEVNGEEVTADNQVTIKARERVTMRGRVTDPEGNPLSDFNGPLSVQLYDAEYSTTSLGLAADGTSGEKITFEEQGGKLFTGRTTVSNGEFEISFAMPAEVANNFRPAAVNMYASSSTDNRDAVGCNRDIYVYGFDDTADPDSLPPTIEYAYMNHESFQPGGIVDSQPMFIARVSDDTGINLSASGIGHQMTLKLDDTRSYSDVSLYYTPSEDGTPSGTIAYPMGTLQAGPHSLAFRVWDTSGNSTTHVVNFHVDPNALPSIFDVYTDANPATDQARFYVSHNRPDAMMTLRIDIYDMLGHRVWSATKTDRSDMFVSAPVVWDLCNQGGHRVNRGIYIYRATVTTDGGKEIRSKAKRIAVTGR